MSQVLFAGWLTCLRSCLEGGGRVSDCVYRMVGVSQVVFTEWWACLGLCLQVVGIFAW